ncbi:MAG: CRTAC1 family protein [Yoonia sp.]|nr:CRTAC1 family protein [Yoonia sp.]
MLACASPAAAQVNFEDVSSALPAHAYTGGWEHFVGGGLAVFDCNGDTLPDIFAAGGDTPAALIRNLGDFKFTRADVPEITGTTGAYPINIDGDDYVDIFVLRVGPNVILKGGPDCSFTDATRQLGIPQDDRWSTAFTAWWNTDRPHLAIGNYVDRTDPDGPFEACDHNVILAPDQNGYNAEALTPGFCPLSILAANDARGRPTLRLSNDRHYYVSGGSEQMWDIGEQRFLGPDDGWQTTSLWGMGIAARDLNADGRDEVMLTSMGDQLLQIAQADGTYVAAPYSIGTYAQRPHVGDDGRPSTGWHAEFGDINNDGRADLFIAKGNVDQMPGMATRDPNNLLLQNSDGTFTEVSQIAGTASIKRSRGGALADFDGDGLLDLIVSNRRSLLALYRNTTPDTGNWVAVDLQQSGGNRNAVGSTVTVTANGLKQTVQHTIGGGHAGGQLLPRHFGLGDAVNADIQVTWPDGAVTNHTSVGGVIATIRR